MGGLDLDAAVVAHARRLTGAAAGLRRAAPGCAEPRRAAPSRAGLRRAAPGARGAVYVLAFVAGVFVTPSARRFLTR
ncbi:hypothetical protein [Dactylosporangium matsuzakiense]|uniref:hypothetical protein n=1 Tax=Dactylosporangium matsuzakiense TaxID=53360 RepID=UPI0021C2BAAA|nr:hypothetical protein [Dactylosporangium matsuzakiense]UWZ45295.1 hypothetical protein Dmats_01710 [Dactylosporangium matsuzakiense]